MTETDASDTVVLIVEDERGLADVFTEWLESEYDVRTAYGGQEALNLFDSVSSFSN